MVKALNQVVPVGQRAASAPLLNIGHMLSDNTSLDLLTGDSHFLSLYGTGLFFPLQASTDHLTVMC